MLEKNPAHKKKLLFQEKSSSRINAGDKSTKDVSDTTPEVSNNPKPVLKAKKKQKSLATVKKKSPEPEVSIQKTPKKVDYLYEKRIARELKKFHGKKKVRK